MSGRQILKGAVDQSTIIRIMDSTDGTPETGVVAATAGLALSYRREGAAVVALTESDLAAVDSAHADGGMFHIGAGYYRVDLPDAAVATGVSGVLVFGLVTGMVVIGTYHSLVDFSLEGQSAADLKDFADAGYDPATNKVQGVVLTDTLTTYTGNTVQTGDSFARLGAPVGASISADIAVVDGNVDAILVDTADMQPKLGTPAGVSISADIAAIEAQTDDIGVAGAGLTAVPWNAAWDAEVQSEVQDALEANNLDHIAGTATGIPAIPAGTYIDQMMDDGTAVYDRTTDSLQAIRDHATTIKTETASIQVDTDAIEADTQDIQARLPAALVSGRIDASVGAMASGVVTATAVATGAIDADALAADAVAEIADGVWDEDIDAAHQTANTAGKRLDDASTTIASNLDASVSTRATPAQVNTEVVDALATDTYAEPGQGAPAATTTLAAKINYVYKAWRNKKDNSGTETKLYADDGTTVDQKQSTSESGGTITKGEWITGA